MVLAGGLVFLGFAATLELTWPQQLLLGLMTVLIAIWMDRSSSSYLVTLTLMLVSCFSTFRYGFWRIATVIRFFKDPGNQHWTALDAFFMWLLVLAESYAFLILFLGYLQTLWPLRRTPVPLPEETDDWPAVDLLIPTYNEPLSVVRFTALAALNIDWPADKLNVYILDDGKREEFRAFAAEAGIGYMTRDDNKHAKAGKHQSRPGAAGRAVRGDLRFRPRADAVVSAGDAGLVFCGTRNWRCCRRRTIFIPLIRLSAIWGSFA